MEDDREISDAVLETLTEEGYEVFAAFDGEEALRWLRRSDRPPCLVLLDLMMPVMTGAEVLDIMRAEEALKNIPVVVVSASNVPEVEGATASLRKPFDIERLLATVTRHCPPRS